MKKYICFAAALAIVGAASCNKELVDNNAPEVPEVKIATLTATIGEPDTKTTLAAPEGAHTNGSVIHWAAEDALSVFDGASNVKYTIKTEEDVDYTPAATAVFEGAALAEAEGYYALYPYTETATLADGVIKGAVLPATQTAVAGNIPAGAALAVAYTEDRSEIHFKNVATIIGFTLTEAATEVSFVAKGEENIAGIIDVNFEEGLPTYTVQNETGSNKVTLENLEAGTYYFTILPDVTLSQGYEFYIGEELAKSNDNELPLVPSKIYSLGEVKVPLKDRGLSFPTTSFEITWGDDFTEPTLDGETDGVTYESSDPETVSVNTETGEVNILKAGTVTITATAPETETYLAGTDSYTLIVKEKAVVRINNMNGWDNLSITIKNGSTTIVDKQSMTNEGSNIFAYELDPKYVGQSVTYYIEHSWYQTSTKTITLKADSESSAIDLNTTYLQPNDWNSDSPRYGAHIWVTGKDGIWVDAKQVKDNFYEVEIPVDAQYTNIIWCRMDSSKSSNEWASVWNKTGDLTINHKCYCIQSSDAWKTPTGEYWY